jgi:hypothetical protein
MAIARERLTTEEIVRLNRQDTFISWSAQAKVNPIVIARRASRSRPSTRRPPRWLRWMLDFGPTVCLR